MFYRPQEVNSTSSQIEKVLSTLWIFTPLPWAIFISDALMYSLDFVTPQSENEIGTFPSMYDNWLASLFLNFNKVDRDKYEIWGPLRYYDLFSLRGATNYVIDAAALIFVLPFEIYRQGERIFQQNWKFLDFQELFNFVDQNRLIVPYELEPDPYDFDYWSELDSGMDCNGNFGKGYYCYCPSQGY